MTRNSRQERAYQKRRHDKWQERNREKSARRRRVAMVGAAVLGIAVIAGIILLLVINRPEPTADLQPAPDVTQPASSSGHQHDSAPDPAEAQGRSWDVTLRTSVGDIALEIDGAAAPQAAANFLHLATDGYFNGTGCHRLLPASLLQCGDPTGTGTGGPGYTFGPIENAPSDNLYPEGTLAMARQGNNGESMGSQFFLVFADVTLPSDSAGGYSVFGHVTEGLEILQQVGAAGTLDGSEQPALSVTIEGVTLE